MATGADIANAYVQIIPSAEGIKGQLTETMGGEAEKAGKASGGKFASALGKGIAAGGTAIATATVAMTTALVNGTSQVAEYGDHIDKMSQKLGISATAYQEWDAIMQHSGTSIDSMQKGIITLTKAAESDSKAFQALGLSQEEVASMNQEELFAATIKGLQDMEEGSERTALASSLLGGAAKELGPLLNTSAEDTEAMRQRVHELGGVMSDEAVKASAAYQDSLQDMKTAFDGAKNSLIGDFMPGITSVMDGLTEIISGGDGLPMIKEGVSDFVHQISEVLPQLIDIGSGIVVSLADAIVENLPALLDSAVSAISTITEGLLTPENIEKLVNASIDIILALSDALVDALPLIINAAVILITTLTKKLGDPDTLMKLVKAAIEIIKALVKGLIDAVPQLIKAAVELIKNLANALVQNFPQIIAKGKEIVGKIAEGIRSALSTVMTVGRSIVEGIWSGISNAFGWIKEKITGWVGNVMSFIKNLFGIHSPSSWARDTIGANIALGIGEGFEDEIGTVKRMMQGALPELASVGSPFRLGFRTSPTYQYGGVTIQILGREKDADTLARELQGALERRAAVWA